KFLEYVHELRDYTDHTTGIIFSGPQYFKDNIEKWKNRGVIGVPELYRRINHWEILEHPQVNEIRGFCNYFNLSDEKIVQTLYETCENFSDVVNRISEYLKNHKNKR